MPPVSRQEVLARREEMMEDVVARIVPKIDEKLLGAEVFPVSYDITPYANIHPEIGKALVEIYEAVGWNVRYGWRRESVYDYGDQRGPAHHSLYFVLKEKVTPEMGN